MVSGSQLLMARRTVGFSRRRLAEQAGTCWQTIASYEVRGDTVLPETDILNRLVGVLKSRGVQFRDDGIFVERATPISRTAIHSEVAA